MRKFILLFPMWLTNYKRGAIKKAFRVLSRTEVNLTMEYQLLVSLSLFAVGTVASVLLGKEKWLLFSGISTIVAAAAQLVAPYAFLYSEFIDGFVTDDVAQLLRYVGCVHFITGPMLLWSRKSKDGSVQWAAMFSQAFAFLAINASAIVLYFSSSDQAANPNRLFSLALTLLWLWGSGFYLLTSNDKATRMNRAQSDVDIYLARDFLISVVTGVFILLFPVQTVGLTTTGTNEVSALAMYEVTSIGLILMGSSFVSYLAKDFQQDEDKMALLVFRVLNVSLLLLSLIHHRYESGFLTSIYGVAQLVLLLSWSCNAILGILSLNKDKKE